MNEINTEQDLIAKLNLEDPEFEMHLEETDGELSVDVFETDTHLNVIAPVAGVELEDLDISLNDDEVLTIKGERSACIGVRDEDFLTRECVWGTFSRSILLPKGLDVSQIRATFKRGVLRVEIPKIKKQRQQNITITG